MKSSTVKGYSVTRFYIFILRVILGAAFAVILMRMFYPQTQMIYTVGLWGLLVGMAYVFEYLRARKP
ncbi:MAG: hypothetical protein HY881_05310 [Deltaproteobacteria bacterium]|nr:hypothetical protein [Deltaproteobacteria bacterium]